MKEKSFSLCEQSLLTNRHPLGLSTRHRCTRLTIAVENVEKLSAMVKSLQ
jgi:hypothetical protein